MLKYVIIGAGGTGGIIGAYMTKAGKDVTIIARGNHLSAMRKGGLTIEKLWDNGKENIKVNVCDTENYDGKADVVFVCVKSYSVDEIIPFIKKISHKDTVVIPILNVYGTGAVMQKKLPDLLVTDGCIYVSANIKTPGVILQHGKICRILFGTRDHLNENRLLETIAEDLRTAASTVYYLTIFKKMLFRNFLMCRLWALPACILTLRRETFSTKGLKERCSKGW